MPAIAIDDWRVLVKTRCFPIETKVLQESMRQRDDQWEEAIVVSFHRLSRFRSDSAEDRAAWEDAHQNDLHRSLLAELRLAMASGFL